MLHLRTITLVSIFALASCTSVQLTPEEHLSRQVIFTVSENSNGLLMNGYAEPNAAQQRNTLAQTVGNVLFFHRLKIVSQWSVKALGLKAIIAEIRGEGRTVDEVLHALSQDQRVESAQSVATYDLLTYNDPYFHLQNASVRGADIEKIHSLATGKDVVVAVVDTGVDRQHPELIDRIIMSRNFVDHDQNQFDIDEHGTSVAGIIGSTANNDLGIVGVAPEVKLMVFKACWQNNETRRARCDSYSLMKSLVEVIKQQPDILNLSLSGPPDPLIERLLTAASDRGIIIVAAVDPSRKSSFPASMPQVIAVSAPVYLGARMPANSVLAPGTDVLTTTPGATYAFRSGSSIATAYVSGIAALMKEREPTLSGEQVRAQLLATSRYRIDMIPVVDICQAVLNDPKTDVCDSNDVAVAIHP